MKKYLDLQIEVLKLETEDILKSPDAELPLMPPDSDTGAE